VQLLWQHWALGERMSLKGTCKEAQVDRKNGASDKKGKWKKKEKSEKTEEKSSVSAINMENGSNPPPDTSEVTKASSQSDSICFYITQETKWMLDLGL
jgi:hypothetical protein